MAIRTILVPLSGGAATAGAIETACRLAQRFGAHLEAPHVRPDPRDALPMLGGDISASVTAHGVETECRAYPGLQSPPDPRSCLKQARRIRIPAGGVGASVNSLGSPVSATQLVQSMAVPRPRAGPHRRLAGSQADCRSPDPVARGQPSPRRCRRSLGRAERS